ncbi:hypothetical protein K8W59_02610 [Nocardioides rotundus]|uniref:methyltransferase n=1 Tax=Nocardioides rotundus TaxID=1774216 RepID=UPI001CBC113F|nr:methyltransferase [Nocardioides rotundus]UAL30436.1 hypothetical protein K8W59_02610 [Nocardioides rotundus]
MSVDDGEHNHRPWTPDEFAAAIDGLDSILIRTAATLGISDHILAGRDNVELLSETLGCDPEAFSRLLRYLCSRGVYREVEGGRLALREYGMLLLDSHPGGLRRWLTTTGPGGRLDAALYAMNEAIRDGVASYPRVHGRGFYEHAAIPSENGRTFHELRADHAKSIAEQLASLPVWNQINHVVDVGGGEGVLLAAILGAHPHLRGTVIDLETAIEGAYSRLRIAGVLARCELHAGSFFERLPAPADIYMLSNVLHNWDDSAARQILRRCRETQSCLLIVEALVDRIDPRVATSMDLRMLAFCGGKERTRDEFEALLHGQGFKVSSVTAVNSELFAIFATPV